MKGLYKPTELHAFLRHLGAHPQKRLSQNFLIDGNILNKIVRTAQIQTGECVVEIGPGPGALTEALLQAGATVIAVEKDRLFADALGRLQNGNLSIFCQDVLDFSLDAVVEAKVVANLPYHLTAPLLAKLLPLHPKISSLTLMVQKEVAQRIVATTGSSHYSSLSLFVRFFANPRLCFTVSPHCFYPAPQVESAVVHLALKAPPAVEGREAFFSFVRAAFQQRRKMLRSSLKDKASKECVEDTLLALGLTRQARPEELSLEQFLALFKRVEDEGK